MASSDPEIKDGFPIPVWMKTKPTKEFEPFAASPPAPEDSFFFIRYPKNDYGFGKNLDKDTNQAKLDQALPKVDLTKVLTNQSNELPSGSQQFKDRDWSKHTKPCQDVLHGIQPINTSVNSASSKPKPAGTDDGFKGEGAACGNSIVKVAHQMMSSGRGARAFAVADPEEEATPPDAHYNLMARRGSKSLPATPAHSPTTSPTSRRKKIGNRYFTSPFEPVEDGSSRSWLTMALLGFKKDLTTSTSTLTEEDGEYIEHRLQGMSLAESVESLGPAPANKELRKANTAHELPVPRAAVTPKPAQAYRPKPSELREMNFWSPTSM